MKKLAAYLTGLTTVSKLVLADLGGACGMMTGYGLGWINQVLFTIALVLLIAVLYKVYAKKDVRRKRRKKRR